MTVQVNLERKAVEVKWDTTGDEHVTVYAVGEEGDTHNTAAMPNDGHAVLTYPADFEGESLVEVRDDHGNVIDSGTIEID